MLKNHKDLEIRQKSYELCLEISYGSVCGLETQILLTGDLDLIEKGVLGTLKKRHSRKRKIAKGVDKVFRKQTLESLTPGILGPSSPTKLEKNHSIQYSILNIQY